MTPSKRVLAYLEDVWRGLRECPIRLNHRQVIPSLANGIGR
jgi:hypothetical protein